jgi:hypothetical protein
MSNSKVQYLIIQKKTKTKVQHSMMVKISIEKMFNIHLRIK